ncbi:MAG: hypothetical protein JNK04_05385 [Myxococcales bacterium]|nr:hypothetical protein [Myxococcales bacterium]
MRGVEGARLSIDGQAVTAKDGLLRCNPGTHLLEARAGERHASVQVEARERQRVEATITLEPTSDRPEAPPEKARGAERGPLAPGIALIATGGAGLLAGAITGGIALAMKEDIGSRCDGNACLASDAEDGATMDRLATASTVCFIVGGALAATGVVLTIVRPGGATTQIALSLDGLRFGWRF